VSGFFYLNRIVYNIPTHIKSSEFQKKLASLRRIPENILISKIDVVSMYTNIYQNHDLYIVRKWFEIYRNQMPESIDVEHMLQVLELVPTSNIFAFGDTNYIQELGI